MGGSDSNTVSHRSTLSLVNILVVLLTFIIRPPLHVCQRADGGSMQEPSKCGLDKQPEEKVVLEVRSYERAEEVSEKIPDLALLEKWGGGGEEMYSAWVVLPAASFQQETWIEGKPSLLFVQHLVH